MPKTLYQGKEIQKWLVNHVEAKKAYHNGNLIFDKTIAPNQGNMIPGYYLHDLLGPVPTRGYQKNLMGSVTPDPFYVFNNQGALTGLTAGIHQNSSFIPYISLAFSNQTVRDLFTGFKINDTVFNREYGSHVHLSTDGYGSYYTCANAAPTRLLYDMLVPGNGVTVTIF